MQENSLNNCIFKPLKPTKDASEIKQFHDKTPLIGRKSHRDTYRFQNWSNKLLPFDLLLVIFLLRWRIYYYLVIFGIYILIPNFFCFWFSILNNFTMSISKFSGCINSWLFPRKAILGGVKLSFLSRVYIAIFSGRAAVIGGNIRRLLLFLFTLLIFSFITVFCRVTGRGSFWLLRLLVGCMKSPCFRSMLLSICMKKKGLLTSSLGVT